MSSGQGVKASRELRAGDLLRVKNESGDFEVEVLALSEVRGPAPVAPLIGGPIIPGASVLPPAAPGFAPNSGQLPVPPAAATPGAAR